MQCSKLSMECAVCSVQYKLSRVMICDDTRELKKCQGRGKSKMDCEEAFGPSFKI